MRYHLAGTRIYFVFTKSEDLVEKLAILIGEVVHDVLGLVRSLNIDFGTLLIPSGVFKV